MQAQSSSRIRTFTIGFHEEAQDEARHARAVAGYLGTDHTELYLTPQDAQAVIPLLPAMFDEPFSDSSQIPTYLVAEMTRQHVTVSLSGDGGDELFGGYQRYFRTEHYWKKLGWLVGSGVPGRAQRLRRLPAQWLGQGVQLMAPVMRRFGSPVLSETTTAKLAELLCAKSQQEFYQALFCHWPQPSQVVKGSAEGLNALADSRSGPELSSLAHTMMYLDAVSYLPDDILVKLDRSAMWVSLETRVPFLDHRIVEFAWSLPLDMKIRGGEGKWLLRQLLYKYVPKTLVERPKQGFSVPLGTWLRGPLRSWADEMLDERRLRHEGFFNPGPIVRKWQEHSSGKHDWRYYLWDVLMFQAWQEQHLQSPSRSRAVA